MGISNKRRKKRGTVVFETDAAYCDTLVQRKQSKEEKKCSTINCKIVSFFSFLRHLINCISHTRKCFIMYCVDNKTLSTTYLIYSLCIIKSIYVIHWLYRIEMRKNVHFCMRKFSELMHLCSDKKLLEVTGIILLKQDWFSVE